jgi:hypothetical protein
MIIAVLLSAWLQSNASVPHTSQDFAWNKPGVSETAFFADVDACWQAYQAELPEHYRRSSNEAGQGRDNLNRYTSSWNADGDAVDAWRACYRARGYQMTPLSRREGRLIYGRFIEEESRRPLLHSIATAERRIRPFWD